MEVDEGKTEQPIKQQDKPKKKSGREKYQTNFNRFI